MPKQIKQTAVESHINRIVGQVKGVKKMIEADKDSVEIVTQIMAAKSSLEKLAVKILKEEASVCNKRQVDKIVDRLFKLN